MVECTFRPTMTWGYIRYNHISFGHGLIHRAIAEGGNAKVTDGEKPSFFENFDLDLEYSPYNEEEENFLNKWYKSYIMQQESQVSRPILPKKGEILAMVCYILPVCG